MRQQHDVRSGRWLAERATGVGGRSLVSFFSKRVGRVGMARGWFVALVLGALGLGVLAGCTGFFQNLVGTDKSKSSSSVTQFVTWQAHHSTLDAKCPDKLNDKELLKKLRHVLGKSEVKKLKKKLEQKGHKMRKEKAQACRTRTQNATTAASSGQLVPLQEAGPDMTLVTIPFDNTDGTSGALYDLQNETDPTQAAVWAGIEQGERYDHLQGDEEKSYLFPGAAPTQQAIADAQQSEGFQELQADMQAQGLSLMSDGIQVVVDEAGQEALLALPVASTATAPASTTGKVTPAAIAPSTYYYAWVNIEEVAVSGTSQVQVGNLRLEAESLGWLRAEDTDDPRQLMSPYNWTARFSATGTGAAVTAGTSTCKFRGSLRVGIFGPSVNKGPSPLTTNLGMKVRGGTGAYTVSWDYGDGSTNRLDSMNCSSVTDTRTHTYYNIGPPEAVYAPQVTVTDINSGKSKTVTFSSVRRVRTQAGSFSPKDRNTPIVLIAGIGTTADNPDYQKIVDQLHGVGYNNVFVVDWAPPVVTDLSSRVVSPGHIPAAAVLRTQKQLYDALGPTQEFIAVGLSGGGLAMRFLIEHPGADVVDPYTSAPVPMEGWDDSRYPPWYGDRQADVAPCTDCGGLGFKLDLPWKSRVKRFYMMASPNHGTPVANYDRCNILAPNLNSSTPGYDWGAACTDLAVNSTYLNAMSYEKPSYVNFDYVAVGSDANDRGYYEMAKSFWCGLFDCGIIVRPQFEEGAPYWRYYPEPIGQFDDADYGYDGVVPAQSPWLTGASHFILWDGDDPGKDSSGYFVRAYGTSVHDRCLVANLWLWNRIIEDIEGRFDNRSDGAVFGQLVYSREGAISGGSDPSSPQPMFQPPPRRRSDGVLVPVNCGKREEIAP
ncbi:PKD domain-containing protein [Candidatus Acetothermia bacterium]|nr:PKD domain-containing protein [Candidatus Acetothermia bacterium]